MTGVGGWLGRGSAVCRGEQAGLGLRALSGNWAVHQASHYTAEQSRCEAARYFTIGLISGHWSAPVTYHPITDCWLDVCIWSLEQFSLQ